MAKTETITIKVTPEEKEQIKKQAAQQDITVSKLLYNIVFKNQQKEGKKLMTIQEMTNILKHYVLFDLEEIPEEKIIEMYNSLFQGGLTQ